MRNPLPIEGWGSLGLFVLGLLPFALLVDTLDDTTLLAAGSFGVVIAAYLGWSYYVTEWNPDLSGLFTAPHALVVMLGVCLLVVWAKWIPLSVVTFVHLAALMLFFYYYWFIGSLAVYHEQRHRGEDSDVQSYRSITVLVPAFNEEGYIGKTLRAVLEAEYPDEKKEIVVVDDGSTDGTYEEALTYASDQVKVVQKENGGKYSALNYGLMFATGDFIVTIDADSIVHSEALLEIVAPLHADEEVGAVASHVKVMNADRLITTCQQLEYIVGMNIYRRMLDLFGTVTIVPGCLGAYRRSVIDDIYAYDPDTLTEDFDITTKVLKTGYRVTVSEALVYTEAPDTWRDLYRQRLRWYRGNFMTIFKHADLLWDPSIGFVHRLAFPLRIFEMFLLPIASWIILALIVLAILQGQIVPILTLFVIFASVIVLIGLIAIQIEGEEWTLALYSPLFVVGYKHFHDIITLKSLVDVLFDREMDWTRATRTYQRQR